MKPRRSHNTRQPSTGLSNSNSIVKRTHRLRLVVAIVGVVLVTRLFYLQVVRYQHYNNLALAEHQKKLTLPATRGSLYFRDGSQIVPAVLNATVYTLYADPKEVVQPEETATVIAAELHVDKNKVLNLLRQPDSAYAVIAKRLSRDAVNKLFTKKDKLRGVNITPVPQRVYPEGVLGAQLLGFVNDDGSGQYGIEGALNQSLQGKAGSLKAVTDVNGVPLSLDDASTVDRQPEDGKNLVLSIDRNIQAQAEQALATGLEKSGATKGSVVVLDPNTGAVRAMANVPSYDPSKYYDVGNDAYEKFRNRVVSDPYEAGSVMKVLTLAAAINEGVVNEGSTYDNKGYVQVDDARIKNVEQDVNGKRTMTDVLKYSLNTGVVYALNQLGGGNINTQARERLYNYFTNHYGFGKTTGVDQAGEVGGTIFGPHDEQGNNVRYANMTFGQGLNVTMIQMVAAFAAVINNGNYFTPHLVEGQLQTDGHITSQAPQPSRTGVVTPQTSAQIRDMTHTALSETQAIKNLITPGYYVGGKTGTSQIIDPKSGQYTDQNAIGSYLGYAADDKLRYVIMVRVDDSKLGGFAGSTTAAPIFAQINNWLLQYYNVRPQ